MSEDDIRHNHVPYLPSEEFMRKFGNFDAVPRSISIDQSYKSVTDDGLKSAELNEITSNDYTEIKLMDGAEANKGEPSCLSKSPDDYDEKTAHKQLHKRDGNTDMLRVEMVEI